MSTAVELFSLGAVLRAQHPESKGVFGRSSGRSSSSSLGRKKYLGVGRSESIQGEPVTPLAWSVEPHEVPRVEYEKPFPSLDEETFRHSGWQIRRRRVWDALRRTHQSAARLDAFAKCGSFAVLEHSAARGRYRLRGNYCHDRFCVPCARARAARARAAVLSRVTRDKLRFITLTLRHSTLPLVDQLARLRKCFSQLRHLPAWKSAVSGGAVFMECKIGQDGLWHPHLHVMAEGIWLDWRVLKGAWLACTGDSDNVDLRLPKGDAAQAVSGYLTKYVSKASLDAVSSGAAGPLLQHDGRWTDAAVDEYVISMKGQHCIDYLGDWRKWEKKDEEADSNIADDWEFVASLDRLLTRYRNGDPIAAYLLFGVDSPTAQAYRQARESPPA